MNESQKKSITWLEFVLIILLASAGMIIWEFADQGVNSGMQDPEAAKNERLRAMHAAQLEADLTTAQAELAVIEQKLAEERLGMAQQTAILKMMEAKYPQLSDIPPMSPETSWVPPAILQRFFATQVEIETTEQIIESLTAQMPNLTDALTDASAKLAEIDEASSADVAIARSALTMAEDDLVDTRKRLREQQLELTRQTATLKGITTAYPQLLQFLTTTDIVSAPMGVFHAYLESQIKLASTQNLSPSLSLEYQQLITRTAALSTELAKATAGAKTEFNWDNPWFSLGQLGLKLMITVLLTLGLIVIVLLVLGSNINQKLVFWGTVLLLAILLIYQVLALFEVTLIGLGLGLLIGLVALLFLGKTSTAAGTGGGEHHE